MSRAGHIDFTRRTLLKGIGFSAVGVARGRGAAGGAETHATSPAEVHLPANAFVISAQRPAVIVIQQDNDPMVLLTAQRLADYILRVTGARPQILSAGDLAHRSGGESVVFFTTRRIPYFRPDGYRISTQRKGGYPAVEVSSPGAAGLKYGCYRLMREMQQATRQVWVPELSVEANPWLKTRELFIADLDWRGATDGEKKALPELQKKFDWPDWDIPRLERYVDFVDALGYNSVMLTDPKKLVAYSGGFVSSTEELTLKVEAMYRRARKNGMGTAFFLWGQEGTGAIPHDSQIERNNPLVKAELSDIQDHWAAVIERFGPWVDRWVLHWADPGGCKAEGCTINTPQVLTNQFLDLLRQKGFSSDVSFSLWALRWGRDPKSRHWPDYIDWTSVVESGVLSPEIGICMMRHYTFEQAKAITNQYRKAGVWGWYLNDIETGPGLHVHDAIQQDEFRRVDQAASSLLDWYSLDDNNHCLNPPSLYVGAQMLWNTHTLAAQALRDFCEAAWGPTLTPQIAQALEAIGEVRCGPGRHILEGNLWPDDYMCWSGKGSSFPAHDLASCEKALDDLEAAKVDGEYVSKMPLMFEPAELLGNIRSHLRYVRDFARIRLAYQQALKPAQEDRRFQETQQKMASLPDLPDSIPDVYGAGRETFYFHLLRRFADTWKGRTFHDNLALGKKTTASSWFNNDPRFAPTNAVNGILCEFSEEGWVAGNYGPAWLKMDLGAVETVVTVRIYNRGYRRELFDNNLLATPAKADVFYAVDDPNPSRGILAGHEPGYELMGGFENWAPTDKPGAYREIKTKDPVRARFVKVVIYSAANNQPVGCGEIEVRGA
jgi:hypothetical protein